MATTSQSNRKPQALWECRTFGDLMDFRKPYDFLEGCCKRCGAYGHVNNWHYSTRASICEPCAIKAKDQLLPRVATAERKARNWVRTRDVKLADAQWLSNLSGAAVSYIRGLIEKKIADAAVLAATVEREVETARRCNGRRR